MPYSHLVLAALILSGPPAPVVPPWSPAADVALAARDAERLGPQAVYVRYLTLGPQPLPERHLLFQAVTGLVNIQSREADLVRPAVVMRSGQVRDGLTLREPEWANATLLRITILDYGWKAGTYERLAEQDAHLHATIETVERVKVKKYWPGGRGKDGVEYAAGDYFETEEQRVKKTALAPWLVHGPDDQAALTRLVTLTHSQTPLLRADNYVWQTAIQFNRKVGFYGLQEVKKRADFQKLVGFDQKQSQEFARELLSAVAISGVSRQPRRIARFEKLGGGYWSTFDNDVATDKANPLRQLNGAFEHKAEEIFAHGSNGLFKVFLSDAQGNRQDSAPDFVSGDRTSPNNDLKIHIGLSCYRCHDQAKGNSGLQPINDWVRNLFRPPLQLTSPDYQKFKELRQSYLRRLEPFLRADRQRHADAMRELLGITPADWSAALARAYADYDAPVTLERAAADLGVTPERFRSALERYTLAAGQIDTVLGIFLRKAEEREGLPLETWLESIPVAQQILAGSFAPARAP